MIKVHYNYCIMDFTSGFSYSVKRINQSNDVTYGHTGMLLFFVLKLDKFKTVNSFNFFCIRFTYKKNRVIGTFLYSNDILAKYIFVVNMYRTLKHSRKNPNILKIMHIRENSIPVCQLQRI